MFRLALRPSPLAFALGLVLVALWALLWLAALAQVLDTPQTAARQPGTSRNWRASKPELEFNPDA